MKKRQPRDGSEAWMRFMIMALILYGPVYAVLAKSLGSKAGALVLIPVLLGSWGGGVVGGVFAATVGCVLSVLVLRFALQTPGSWLDIAFRGGGVVCVIATYGVGIVVGQVRASILRLRNELSVRRRAEARLRATEVRLRASESRLRESESGYRMLFEQNPLPMWVFHPESLAILAANQAAVNAYGHDAEKFLSLTMLDLVLPDQVEKARAWFQDSAGADHRDPGRWRQLARGGTAIHVELTTRTILFSGRRAALATAADVTRAFEVEHKLTHRANHDHLTGLPNRAFYLRRVEAAIAASETMGGSSAVLLIDLDRFKPINDTYGHGAGDEVLKAVAQRLREGLRGEDVAARLGGDEFALLLPESDQTTALEVAARLIASIRLPILAGSHEFQIDASIGAALAPEHGRSASEVLHQADMAMYAAKRSRSGLAVASIQSEPDCSAQTSPNPADMVLGYAGL